jgi:AcrR family transcriptional regulator
MHSDDDAPCAARRGRPRSEKARLAILEAAAELLLARGLSAVSMDAVAERAGVSKATIYRWWHTKEAIALDALYNEWATVRPPALDTGSLRGDLLSLLRPWVRLAVSRPYGRVIAALVTEAQTDPAFAAEYLARFVEPPRVRAAGSPRRRHLQLDLPEARPGRRRGPEQDL